MYPPLFAQRLIFAPGPPKWPVVGNALQVPKSYLWLKLSKWAKQYGGLMYLEILGQPMVIISSVSIATDLLDKRSAHYSNRVHLTMSSELAGFDRFLPTQPYGLEWRHQRKFVAQELVSSEISMYHDVETREAARMVWNMATRQGKNTLQAKESNLMYQVRVAIAAIIFNVTYGYTPSSQDDPHVQNVFQALDDFSRAVQPGAWAVDFIPVLKYLPSWMPGAHFIRLAQKMRRNVETEPRNLYLWSKQAMRLELQGSGTPLPPNICSKNLAKLDTGNAEGSDEVFTHAAYSILAGGLDTNLSTMMSIFLALITYPDVQRRAQAEIDSVIGSDRLPTVNDRAKLPYVRNVVAESIRMWPAAPMGIPHSVDEPDVYNDFFVPKGSIVIANIWHMLRDESVFSNPNVFNPSRFDTTDISGTDLADKVFDIAFGFGRRVCPARHLALDMIFTIVVTVLATCDITSPSDKKDVSRIQDVKYTSGAISMPEPFDCQVQWRSKRAKELVEASLEA
ncbi:hypothetical protein VKT23_011671 [Stygiomarasmius scandens]|uniref:Cytochrome P450 n=1 Tax=Marasmiellus scandens TaxID=2682957 RepID=A0ABR1JCD7_9AGAR